LSVCLLFMFPSFFVYSRPIPSSVRILAERSDPWHMIYIVCSFTGMHTETVVMNGYILAWSVKPVWRVSAIEETKEIF
jgi:hypothetical protein